MVSAHGHRGRRSAGHAHRRRLDPEARRAELLDAAVCVLKDLGPDHARVEDVTRAAGAAKGTFYLYFPSWDDLLLGIRERLLSSYLSEYRARMATTPVVSWNTIEEESVRCIDFIVGLGNVHEAAFHGPSVKRCDEDEHSAESLIAAILSAGMSSGACRPVDSGRAAPLVFAVLHATADDIIRSGDRDAKVETALDLLRNWLHV